MSLVPRRVDRLLQNGHVPGSDQNLRVLLGELREANKKAEAASKEWNKLSNFLNAKYANLELWDKTERRKANITLTGHFDTWHFWQREVMRLAATIQSEIMVRDALKSETQ